MSENGRTLERLQTGVPGLDTVLGDGLPRYSFNIIAGTPGSGKTTLAQQIVFRHASEERPALYVTVLGEPSVKMLRYQQQFDFFDPDKVGRAVHYLNLGEETLDMDASEVVDRILEEVRSLDPALVVVDSFRSFARSAGASPRTNGDSGTAALQRQVQRLALHLASSGATTFLVGEYPDDRSTSNPVFTVADGIIWLYQPVDDNSVTRQLQVVKMRGSKLLPGLHTLIIDRQGVRVFPRGYRTEETDEVERFERRLSTGVEGLDDMLGGGIPKGESVLLAGPAGSGKTTLALQYAGAGLEAGENVVLAVFEERPEGYMHKAAKLGVDLDRAMKEGRAEVVYLRGLDLSVDQTLFELFEAVERIGATRVVVDSVSGFQVAVAPTYEVDFRETLYNLTAFLTDHGVTLLMTVETVETFDRLQFTPNLISLLADTLIVQRYVELEGRLEHVMMVVKMRHSEHGRGLRLYDVDDDGLHVGETLDSHHRVVTGVPLPGRPD